VAQHGDIRQLLASCEAIAAYNGDNYYPLMWRFYRSHRSTLFRLAHTLRFVSTTRDTSVMDALEVVLANEDRTGDYLPVGVNLTFASEKWLRTVLVRTDKGMRLARRHFEVCVFAALAAALKAGDVAVEGSDAYADYREQLLPWSECVNPRSRTTARQSNYQPRPRASSSTCRKCCRRPPSAWTLRCRRAGTSSSTTKANP
jgi:hypothetical protein